MLDTPTVVPAGPSPTVKLVLLSCKDSKFLFSNRMFFFNFYRLFRKRIFILGPSHHVRLRGCALSVAKKYRTPLYDLKIDTQSMLVRRVI